MSGTLRIHLGEYQRLESRRRFALGGQEKQLVQDFGELPHLPPAAGAMLEVMHRPRPILSGGDAER
jgi:hypothetical protein